MNKTPSPKDFTKALKNEALMMAVSCVRNTVIEDYHAGIVPVSKTGDFSDVTVVTPDGEIPWNKLSRISDKEMEVFNKEVVNRLYTYLQFLLNPHITSKEKEDFMAYPRTFFPSHWDKPKLVRDFISAKNRKNPKFNNL